MMRVILILSLYFSPFFVAECQQPPFNLQRFIPHLPPPIQYQQIQEPPAQPQNQGYLPYHLPTITEQAEAFWNENHCVYPPQDFRIHFKEVCSEVYSDSSIFSGICRTFFNISQSICSLSEASEVEKETMLNINNLQEQIGDDDICDTLFSMKQTFINLFPDPVGENEWFLHTYNLLLKNSTCHSICSIKGLHPLCFGILLNFDYVNTKSDKNPYDQKTETVESEYPGEEIQYYAGTEYTEELQDYNETPEGESVVSSPTLTSSDEETNEKEYDTNAIDDEIHDIETTTDSYEDLYGSFYEDINPKFGAVFKYDQFHLGDEDFGDQNSDDRYGNNESLPRAKEDRQDVIADLDDFRFHPDMLNNLLGDREEGDMVDFGEDTVVDSVIAIPDDLLAKNDLEMEMSDILPLGVEFDLTVEYDEMSDDGYNRYLPKYRNRNKENHMDDSEGPLLFSLLIFSCFVACLMVGYLIRMRHRIFGRSKRTSRPGRWNYKKLSTDQAAAY